MLRLPISVIVLTHDEERNIKECLESVRGWCDEIVVVDSGSTDATRAIAEVIADAFVVHPFETYSAQRNWAQNALDLRNQWVLHLDADERVSAELADSIDGLFATGSDRDLSGATFSRRTIFMGRWIKHGGHYPAYHVRLFRRDSGRCEERLYDQHFLVDGPVAYLEGDLIDILSGDLDTWTRRHLRWAGAEALEVMQPSRGRRVVPSLGRDPIARRRWYRDVLFGRTPSFLRAFLYFGYRYILRGGFLDGVEGLIFHFLHACWFRFYVDAKLWEARRNAVSASGQTFLRGERPARGAGE